MRNNTLYLRRALLVACALFCTATLRAQSDITQPGDVITATSANSPGSEGVANAIDNQPTKYLNFDRLNTGFTVTPAVGTTRVTGITLTSANDAVERDPSSYRLEGSNNGTTFSLISEGTVDAFPSRFAKQSINFENNSGYKHYRLIFPTVVNAPNAANSMQISEVELIGTVVPSDVTQPGDPITATSSNSPGSEGVANAIDNQPTKYLNFDRLNTGFTVTPSVGGTIVTGIGLTSANDAIERDPATYRIEGSLDGQAFVTISEGPVPAFPNRFQEHVILFTNNLPFTIYRVIFPEIVNAPNAANSMQISEVSLLGTTAPVPTDVTQPGDTITATSANSPGSEGVANSIDNQPTKYLNFDRLNTGFTVTPSVGQTILKGITLTSANDAIERDPSSYRLEGSNDGTTFTLVSEGSVAPFTARFQKQAILFSNNAGYKSYRLIFPTIVNAPNAANSMQISEVELLGFLAPRDVTQPGDTIVATSSNSPGSEGVANAIDDRPTKYLNFDRVNTGFTVTPAVGATVVSGISLTSANDAVERDPSSYRLEGSQDGTTFELISEGSVPAFPARFSTHYLWFANTTAYRVYRLIFPTVVNAPNAANSMQISEVELLGEVPGGGGGERNDLIRFQPEDQPVLLDSQATFGIILTGPWSVQWLRNGVPISGARSLTYTTPAIASTNANDVYTVEVSGKGGTQTSNPAKIVIFTPSAIKSIGMSWQGGGANGAPTPMFTNDIAGFHQQAYWNQDLESTAGTGDLPAPDPVSGELMPVRDSDNNPTPVTIRWESTGEWGVGTGEDTATRRMLNGMLTATGADPNVTRLIEFGSVPAGTHSVIIYTVQVPLEFFQMDFEVTTTGAAGPVVRRAYIRPQNADEYNAAPGFIRVVGSTPATRSVGNMIRFDGITPGADGLITITFRAPDWVQPAGVEPRRGPGVNAVQLLLNPGTVPQPPEVTLQPLSANAVLGSGVQLTAGVTGQNVQFQWLKNGLPIFGATSSTLTVCATSTNDAGRYRLAFSNPAGRFVTAEAVVNVASTANITEGLVTHLKLDETTGASAANSVTGGAAATLRGFANTTSHWKPGKVGGGLEFDATANYAFVPNFSKPVSGLTASAWIFPSTAEVYGPIVNNWIVHSTRPVGSRGQFFLRASSELDAAGNPVTRITGVVAVGPNEVTVATDLPLISGKWSHVALTADGGAVKLYVDGTLRATSDYIGSINQPNFNWLAVGSSLVLVDADGNPVTEPMPDVAATISPFFGGLIDDVAVWNRGLSAPEIAAVYAAGNASQNVAQVAPVLSTAPCQVGEALELDVVAIGPSSVTLEWVGGTPPFIVQRKGSLSDTNWMNVLSTSNRTAVVPKSGSMGFFQIVNNTNASVTALSAFLGAAFERPTNNSTATGLATLSIEGNTLSYDIDYAGLTGPASAGHIHGFTNTTGTAGVSIPFTLPAAASGRIRGTATLTEAQRTNLLTGKTYVNIHTAANGGGEIRGQVLPINLMATLNGANEKPTAVDTPATGTGAFSLVGNELFVDVNFTGLKGNLSNAHIHGPAAADASAGVLVDMMPLRVGTPTTSGQFKGSVVLSPQNLSHLIDGLTYFNIHSAAHGGGEIRGQIMP